MAGGPWRHLSPPPWPPWWLARWGALRVLDLFKWRLLVPLSRSLHCHGPRLMCLMCLTHTHTHTYAHVDAHTNTHPLLPQVLVSDIPGTSIGTLLPALHALVWGLTPLRLLPLWVRCTLYTHVMCHTSYVRCGGSGSGSQPGARPGGVQGQSASPSPPPSATRENHVHLPLLPSSCSSSYPDAPDAACTMHLMHHAFDAPATCAWVRRHWRVALDRRLRRAEAQALLGLGAVAAEASTR